jgi:hypothetical protein
MKNVILIILITSIFCFAQSNKQLTKKEFKEQYKKYNCKDRKDSLYKAYKGNYSYDIYKDKRPVYFKETIFDYYSFFIRKGKKDSISLATNNQYRLISDSLYNTKQFRITEKYCADIYIHSKNDTIVYTLFEFRKYNKYIYSYIELKSY